MLLSITGNLLEWSKWTMDEIMNTPFVPMMLAINSFLEQQERLQSVDFSDKKFVTSILAEHQDSGKEFEFE